MPFGRPWAAWIAEYGESHQTPVNRATHTVGIPMIALSVPLVVLSPFVPAVRRPAAVLFGVGWTLQFAGHAVEGKPPEFFRDWRFLFVGLRWWGEKVRGRA